jgi:hypothetical protein
MIGFFLAAIRYALKRKNKNAPVSRCNFAFPSLREKIFIDIQPPALDAWQFVRHYRLDTNILAL